MKKITYSLIAVSLLGSMLNAGTDLDSSLSQDHTFEKKAQKEKILSVDGWEISGDIRAGLLDYGYGNAPKQGFVTSPPNDGQNPLINKGHGDSRGIYLIPKVSISSPKDSRIKAKVTIAGATDFGINDSAYEGRTFVFGEKRESYLILNEGYLSYEDANHKFLVGREELTTPMIDGDDWYMLSNSFELAYYTNSSVENLTLYGGYFSKMAGIWDSGAEGTEFHSMSSASYAQYKGDVGSKGVYFAAAHYDDKEHHNAQAWEYLVDDLYNMFFAQYDYTGKIGSFEYDAGVQFMNFKEVGYQKSHAQAGEHIDYSLYSARFDGSFSNGINFATGVAKYTDGEGQGQTLGAFGGYPYFANGMIFHFFEAGSLQNAASFKAQLGYDFEKIGVKNLWIGYRYTQFSLDSDYSKSTTGLGQDKMAMNGIRVSYGASDGAYFTGTYEGVDVDHEPGIYSLRLIGGYRF